MPSNLKPIHLILVFFLLISIIACEQEQMHPKEFINWVHNQENEFRNSKELNQMEFTAFYKPPAYLAIKKAERDQQALKNAGQGYSKDFDQWFTFTFRLNSLEGIHPLEQGNEEEMEYFRKLQYYINAKDDFQLVIDDTDTLECAMYHYERNYGAAPYMDINLAFKREKTVNKNVSLLYLDRVFSNGLIKFKYDEEKFNQLPKIID